MKKTEQLTLTKEWDKTFPKSEKVEHKKVTFVNHFGITLAADMYVPKNAEGKLPAIAVSVSCSVFFMIVLSFHILSDCRITKSNRSILFWFSCICSIRSHRFATGESN